MLLTSFFGLGCNLYIMRVLHSDEHSGHACSHDHGETGVHSHDHNHSHSHSHNHNHNHAHSHDHGHESNKHIMKLPNKDHAVSSEGDSNHQTHNHELLSSAIGSNEDMKNSPAK